MHGGYPVTTELADYWIPPPLDFFLLTAAEVAVTCNRITEANTLTVCMQNVIFIGYLNPLILFSLSISHPIIWLSSKLLYCMPASPHFAVVLESL